MLIDEQSKLLVHDTENVIRLLSEPTGFNGQRVTEEAFDLYHKDEDYVSVLRESFVPDDEVVRIGSIIKRWPGQTDTFYGYCRLNVERIRRSSSHLDVVSCYTESFPSHAGIVYLFEDGQRVINHKGQCKPPFMLVLQGILSIIANEDYHAINVIRND